MKTEIKYLDVVALTEDIKEYNLLKGQVGTVVEILDNDSLEVEFSDNSGKTYAILPLKKARLIQLHYEPLKVA